jgi:hypothetical protein
MSFSITVSTPTPISSTTPLTAERLNKLFLPTASVTGTLDADGIGLEAMRNCNTVPGPFFYCASSYSGGIYSLTAIGYDALVASRHADGTLSEQQPYITGTLFFFIAGVTNSSKVFVSINNTTPMPLLSPQGDVLGGGAIVSGQPIEIAWNGTSFRLLGYFPDDSTLTLKSIRFNTTVHQKSFQASQNGLCTTTDTTGLVTGTKVYLMGSVENILKTTNGPYFVRTNDATNVRLCNTRAGALNNTDYVVWSFDGTISINMAYVLDYEYSPGVSVHVIPQSDLSSTSYYITWGLSAGPFSSAPVVVANNLSSNFLLLTSYSTVNSNTILRMTGTTLITEEAVMAVGFESTT